MMNKQDAIEMLKSMLPEKISYAELIGASGCYGDGGFDGCNQSKDKEV